MFSCGLASWHMYVFWVFRDDVFNVTVYICLCLHKQSLIQHVIHTLVDFSLFIMLINMSLN